MALRIVTADERMAAAAQRDTFVIFGRGGVGKTTLVTHLDEATTVFLEIEAGMNAIRGWRGRHIPVETWPDFLDFVCLLCGPDPAADESQVPAEYAKAPTAEAALAYVRDEKCVFTQAHYNVVRAVYADRIDLSDVQTIFGDSISEATKLAITWANAQPGAFSERTGKPDIRGAYGIIGRLVPRALRRLQRAPARTVVMVGGLKHERDEFGRESFEPQMEGQRIAAELPYITDQVITFSDFEQDGEVWRHAFGTGSVRAFCCKSPNPWGLPAKDRSGRLDMIEEPHLGRLIEKIRKVQ